ncbi:CRE-CRI-1 protein [Caenorhabditis remanei]|uniref:CRE-CRI-1 protein n=1 Tax=Caenorhabditis remanei TaxID=31234 RepID=E3M3R9_CAERE|nr:CRE-CRI-1 protein [Caenorhabditis remanei]
MYGFRDRKKSCDSDEYRKRSNTLQSNRSDKRWPKRDMGPQFELRCCIDPEILRINVDRQYYFEDETVRVNGSVFHKRHDYNNLLSVIPRAKFNGIHIKMEDDCPQGGDDVRLCLLKSLGAHNLRSVPCVQCKDDLKVISSGRCCPTVCQTCRQPLGVRDQLATQLANGNYATINEQMTCQSCGVSKFHLVRDIKTCHVARGPSFCE